MERRTSGRGLAAAAAFAAFLLVSSAATAAGPSIMPGFPIRAGGNVMIMWLPYAGAASYVVYRGEAKGGPYQKVGEGAATNFMDANVPGDKTFYYVIKPVVGGKEGEASAEGVIKGLEAVKPPVMSAHLITANNQLGLRWSPVPGVAYYNLYKSEKETGDLALLTSVQDVQYTDTTVKVGQSYRYAVTSVSTANVESPKSAIYNVKIETQAAVTRGPRQIVRKKVQMTDYFDVDPDTNTVLQSPGDMDLEADGTVCVVDGGTGYVYRISQGNKFLGAIAKPPKEYKGDWGRTMGIAVDRARKELVVAYSTTRAVRVFNLDGDLLRETFLGKPDPKSAPDQNFDPIPIDVAVGVDGTIWVSDAGYYQLVGIGRDGKVTRRVGIPRGNPDRKKDPGSFITPGFVAVNPKDGNVYVTENLTQKVFVFDKGGKFVKTIGESGTGAGGMVQFGGFNFAADGTFVMGDANESRIQLFGADGGYLATFVDPKLSPESKQPVIAPASSGVALYGKTLMSTNSIENRLKFYTVLE